MEHTKAAKSTETRPDLRFWLEDWVTNHRDDVSDARRSADRTRIRRYIIPQLGRRSVSRLDRAGIEEWISDLQEEGVGDATIHASLLALRGALEHARESGQIRENPARGVQVKGLQAMRTPTSKEILTEKQLQRLLKHLDPWYRPLVLFAARTGAKWEEAIGLRVQDVYLDHCLANLGRLRAVEAGGHITYTEGRPADSRVVEMPPDLCEALGAYIEETQEFRSDTWPFVFLTKRDHKHPLRPNFNTFILKPALDKAALDSTVITYHTLRHTAAVHMIREGWELDKISKALGHRTTTTTRRIYKDFMREQAAKTERA